MLHTTATATLVLIRFSHQSLSCPVLAAGSASLAGLLGVQSRGFWVLNRQGSMGLSFT